MALWKPFRGNRTALDTVEKRDGFVYFCTDDGSLFFDYLDAEGVLQRKQINAKEAEALTGYSVETILSSSNAEIPTSKAVLDAIAAIDIGMVSITYSELKQLRDNSQLVPSAFYRITDYVCTSVQADTRAMTNQFDIVVQALSEDKLSENASAIHHEGDTYFANANLPAWELKYSLDNDTTRFAWADETNGKGVIYYMKDEYSNECPYDFKNITYLGSSIRAYETFGLDADTYYPTFTLTSLVSYFQWGTTWGVSRKTTLDTLIDGINYYGYTCSDTPIAWSSTDFYVTDEVITTSSTMYNITDGTISTVDYGGNLNVYGSLDSSVVTEGVRENVILPYDYANNRRIAQSLNHCILIGDNCYNNTFANHCFNNALGSGCYFNTFGESGRGNTFGNYCNHNTFGNNCFSNTFGNYCSSNTFSNNCSHNTFGNYCSSNTFSNNCSYNTFGNYCESNTFGNSCNYINMVGDNIKYIEVCSGVTGALDDYLTITPESNADYQQIYRKSGSQEILV